MMHCKPAGERSGTMLAAAIVAMTCAVPANTQNVSQPAAIVAPAVIDPACAASRLRSAQIDAQLKSLDLQIQALQAQYPSCPKTPGCSVAAINYQIAALQREQKALIQALTAINPC